LTQERRNFSLIARGSQFRNWIAIIVENLAILLINASSPRKTSSRARKIMIGKMRRRKKFFKKKNVKQKKVHKRKGGKAYVIGDWFTDVESTSSFSSSEEDDEKVTAIVVDFSSPPPSLSSTTYICLMAKGDRKVQNVNPSDGDSDDEYTSPTYDELADLLKEYTQIIRKSTTKCGKLKDENKSMLAKYDIIVKASDEMKEEN
jgi:hypothetical protein